MSDGEFEVKNVSNSLVDQRKCIESNREYYFSCCRYTDYDNHQIATKWTILKVFVKDKVSFTENVRCVLSGPCE